MLTTLNVLILLVGSGGTLCALGGKTWLDNDEPLAKRITLRGWVSLACLFVAIVANVSKEVVTHSEAAVRDVNASNEKQTSEKVQAETQAKLAVALADLSSTKADLTAARKEVADSEQRLAIAISRAVEGMPRQVDHPYFESGPGGSGTVISSINGRPVVVTYGDMVEYYITTQPDKHRSTKKATTWPFDLRPDMDLTSQTPPFIRLNAGASTADVSPFGSSQGQITVIGAEGEQIPLRFDYSPNVNFTAKITISSVRR